MFRLGKVCSFYVQTPLHAGSGQDVGLVDLPIQRERHTGWPKIEGSGVKGAIREICRERLLAEGLAKEGMLDLVFGPESVTSDSHASALGFSDARILLFPVKSMRGVFAHTTCPSVLQRLVQDLEAIGAAQGVPQVPKVEDKALLSSNTCLVGSKILLEEFAINAQKDGLAEKWGQWLSEKTGISEVQNRLAILSDDDFRDFVELSTEVVTRTKIDPKTGTVSPGALFTEEFLPAESVLYTLALASPIFYDGEKRQSKVKEYNQFLGELVAKLLQEGKEGRVQPDQDDAAHVMLFLEMVLPKFIQLGGDATLGKGLVRTQIWS